METEKKYLKTIEEVSDALAAGKVVFCDAIKTKYHKDKNNIIIGESEEFGDYVGDSVEMHYSPYILEPKPLEVKLYHLYKDNSGDTFFIGKCREGLSGAMEFIGIGASDGIGFFLKSGKRLHRCDFPCFNLVEELVDLSKYFEKEPDNAKND